MIPLRSPDGAQGPTAVALGSFDGLHRGHRRVIAAVTGSSSPVGVPLVPTVVSFWPHPREVLYGDSRLRLDLPGEKLSLLEPLGIDQLVLVPFSAALAQLSPEAFVQRVLVDQLQAGQIAVGENFRFGAGRRGDAAALARIGQELGVIVTVVPMLWDGPERFSSSRIRRALASGELAEAARLLERPYRFSGQVVQGRQLGRQLGWPTANLQVDGRKFLPLEGVYAAWTRVNGAEPLAAVMNLGPLGIGADLALEGLQVREGLLVSKQGHGFDLELGPHQLQAAAQQVHLDRRRSQGIDRGLGAQVHDRRQGFSAIDPGPGGIDPF